MTELIIKLKIIPIKNLNNIGDGKNNKVRIVTIAITSKIMLRILVIK